MNHFQLQEEKDRKARIAQLTESAKQRVWEESKNLQKDVSLRDEMMRKREALLNVNFQIRYDDKLNDSICIVASPTGRSMVQFLFILSLYLQ